MTAYAIRLANGQDSAERMRRADALALAPSGPGLALPGLRNDGGGAVTVQAGTMNVQVAPFTAWVDGGVSDTQGGYSFGVDATATVALTAGHATLARVDTIVAEVRDDLYDASGFTDARVRVVQGTPGSGAPTLPTNCLPLRDVNVPAGTSAGTGGLAAGNLGADRRTYTAGLGGVVPVTGQTQRDALPQIKGTVVYRADTDAVEVLRATGWQRIDGGVPWRIVGNSGEPPFLNNWVNVDPTTWTVAGFRKVGDMVQIRGMVKLGTVGTAIFGLPSGYRPARGLRFIVDANGSPAQLVIDSDANLGGVFPTNGTNAAVSINVQFSVS